MSASCPFCEQSFASSGGLFGQDATLLRDAHVLVCEANPRNRCFCGVVFPNHAAKEKHAATCAKNPANQFKCTHCSQEFLNSFGMMGRLTADGKALRDAHAISCKENPANTCFCGNVFPNPEARNAHAVTCDMNPANRYQCQFCQSQFVKTFNMFGFCSRDGRTERDDHQVGCEKNPKNRCFCGKIFPNPTARDRHAVTCQDNPVNQFQCSFCKRLFVTRFGVMGRTACDGKAMRDTHEVGCEKNPANVCFCGQLFLNPAARDAHAVKCEMNPANRFSCKYCHKTFVTTFGFFSSNGGVERDAHLSVCSRNPVNATCRHCNKTFTDTKGPLGFISKQAHARCEEHVNRCKHNPKNRFNCERCGKLFITTHRFFLKSDGRTARDQHCQECDLIPCDYEVKDSDIDDWLLMSSGTAGDERPLNISNEFRNDLEATCQPCLTSDAEDEDTLAAADSESFGFHDAESSQGEETENVDENEEKTSVHENDPYSDEEKDSTQDDDLRSEIDSDTLGENLANADSDSEFEALSLPVATDADLRRQSPFGLNCSESGSQC